MSDRYLLPSNATPQEVAMAGATARVGDVPTPARDLYNPDVCPAAFLPWLAWTYSVDEWNPQWTEAQKRAAIKNSIFVHKHKGTIGAVRTALAALGFGAQMQEWFNQTPAGAPYTYRLLLEADQVGIDQEAIKIIEKVVASTKNLRSHLDTIVPSAITHSGPVLAAVCGSGNEITIAYGGAPLTLDGTFTLNGTNNLNGFRL